MNEWNLKKTILDRKLTIKSLMVVLVYIFIIVLISNLFFIDFFSFKNKLAVSNHDIFFHKEYYRLFTATLVHADYEHLGSNLLLFFPFSLYLCNSFGLIFFPLSAFLAGAVINYFAILYMPEKTELIGLSGVVYYVGFLWITLYFFNNRKINLVKRFIKATGVALILFFPTMIRMEVSYLSHFLGAVLGVVFGVLAYLIYRKTWIAEDEYEIIEEESVAEELEIIHPESEIYPVENKYLH